MSDLDVHDEIGNLLLDNLVCNHVDEVKQDYTDKIHNLQNLLLNQEQAWHGEIHHFAPGVYTREFRCFENTLLVGKTHRHEHMFILLEGKCTVTTEDKIITLEAPYIGKSPAGVKRALYTHTDIIWVTIHPTNETDVAKIEEWLTVPDDEVREFRKMLGLDCKSNQGVE
ncbi:hypothetical protein [Acinetobacter sp. Marseille-Q1618]|uniref:hypothetical protein n=1 Tax=Acinetobacter sp. Marseille-Q1618 TaxID=2697502 RepID=UPI00156F87EA|nr:hypothetical protein [Acinetobacter sp. Marseille-Q1618]